ALQMSAFGGKADIAIAVSCIWPGPDPRRALWPAALRVPHEQAEHMAAPTKAANVKKALAKAPSTRDPKRTSTAVPIEPRPRSIQAASKGLVSFDRSVACWVSGSGYDRVRRLGDQKRDC